ncbi:parathyroid hormone 2 receptor-like isoform X2 [Clavelina lepadiformis]|uniref:parathyroid hormone 2 receptor-like isoform X2 n=1 Tax=Clavelina lepadiformis TaxID=159417 RepID=UPI004042D6B6
MFAIKAKANEKVAKEVKKKKKEPFTLKGTISRLAQCRNVDCFIICVVSCCLIPLVFVLALSVPKTMADDGLLTTEELLDVLATQMKKCQRDLTNDLAPKDAEGNYLTNYCKGEWDKLTCWPNSPPGETVSIRCPEYIPDFDHEAALTRICTEDGTWQKLASDPNHTWSDYSRCPRFGLPWNNEENPKIKSLILLYTIGYSCSLVALIFAMGILGYFKRLHCTRNYIHMHLFASFILRAAVIFVKDRVLYYGSGIMDVRSGDMSIDSSGYNSDNSSEIASYRIGCKVVMTLFHYFVATNYYWILAEALYLHSLIFVAFFSDKKYLWRFILTGWGVPVIFVIPWAVVRATLDDTGCWDIAVSEYKWIYNGPIVVANVINFLLFLNIIRVLWYKMRERGLVGGTDNRTQYMKLAKSTLVLIPMFGVHAIVFLGMPENIHSGIWWDIRMYFDLFFNSFQGFFVAIIYCFCNGEVQAEFRKAWDRFNLSVEIQKGRRERSRSSVTMLTSFNSSASQQARLSIGGQSNGRGPGYRSNGTALLNQNNLQVNDGKFNSSVNRNDNIMWNSKAENETSFVVKPNENSNNNEDHEGSPLLVNPPPFIRRQSSTLPKGSDVIVPIAEERALEEAFESAIEDPIEVQLQCPAKSFLLADELVDPSEEADAFDDVISRDEMTTLRQKRMQHAKRAESEDSGISSVYLIEARSGKGDGTLSVSDYCGDSEGGVSDDHPHSSDSEGIFEKNSNSSDITIPCDVTETNFAPSSSLVDVA